jgi:hypothetical protein
MQELFEVIMSQDDPTNEAEIEARGFCNPPIESRFRKGESGNPAGRPKGSKNRRPVLAERFRSLMLEEAYRPIRLSKDGQEFTLPMTQVVLRKLAQAAAKGDARAQAMFFKMVSTSANDEVAIEEMVQGAHVKATAEEPIEIQYNIVDEKGRTVEVYRSTNGGDIEKVIGETPSTE